MMPLYALQKTSQVTEKFHLSSPLYFSQEGNCVMSIPILCLPSTLIRHVFLGLRTLFQITKCSQVLNRACIGK